MQWYLEVLKKYAIFEGRASRSEYWYFTLVHNVIIILLLILLVWLQSLFIVDENTSSVIVIVYLTATFLPSLAVIVRRLHDIGKSGWWIFINIIPFGFIVLLIYLFTDSQSDSNQYGSNPKEDLEDRIKPVVSDSSAAKTITTPPVQQVFNNRPTLASAENSHYPTFNISDEITVGRGVENTVQINNEYISTQHLRIGLVTGGGSYVTDLNSTNGTYINGEKLKPQQGYDLQRGDRLILGSEEVVYKIQ